MDASSVVVMHVDSVGFSAKKDGDRQKATAIHDMGVGLFHQPKHHNQSSITEMVSTAITMALVVHLVVVLDSFVWTI